MRHLAILVLFGALLLAPAVAQEPVVRVVDFETTVNPVSVRRIAKAIEAAEADGDELVLIEIDTPGGLVDSMDYIVKRMLNAKVPIAVWVGPSGARAASAGFFILIAADVAAMAPGTRTGAAASIFGTGEGSEDNVLLKKVNEDHAALLRSIADRRGRNAEACEEAIFSAKAFEETVALERGLIDLVVQDRAELLERLDGTEIRRFDGTTVTLRTADARIATMEFSLRQKFMEFLGNPSVAYILLSLGLLGLCFEMTHPGAVLPGVAGAGCLLLFAIAAQALPISTIGLLLIVLAVVMFILEVKVASYGMLTFGGVVVLLLGSLMLVEGPIPELRVPLGLVLPVTIAVAAICVVVVRLAIGAQRERVATGVEGLTGEVGTVTQDLAPEGKVQVHGEIWNAESTGQTLPRGSRVRVVRVVALKLTVEPAVESNVERS
jgi:membrane-bound serine protease (ClpP class)